MICVRYLYRDLIIKIKIFDTASQRIFRNINIAYTIGADCVLVFFKANSKSIEFSYNINDAIYFLSMVNYNSSHCMEHKINLYLIGNSFGDGEYSIQKNIAEETAKEFNAKYFEISCNDGTGIEELITNIISDYSLLKNENDEPLKTSSKKLNKMNKENNKNCNIY